MTMQVRVYNNGDDAFLVWRPEHPIPNCRGFAILRRLVRDQAAPVEAPLTTWVGFEGESAPPGTRKLSTEWPVQKFMWTDYDARRGDVVSYRIVPMIGADKSHLVPSETDSSSWVGPVKLSAYTDGIAAYFNRGVVATQWLARRLATQPGSAPGGKLLRVIREVGNQTRDFLAGEIRVALVRLLHSARESGGHVYAALFELNDPELTDLLKSLGGNANVVLGNGSQKKGKDDPNRVSRRELTSAGVHVYNRMTAPAHLAHNKFLVVCDQDDRPRGVWTGSTNWSMTGLCTQANNAVYFNDSGVAEVFHRQWERLKGAGNVLSQTLRNADSSPSKLSVGGAEVRVWFAPTVGYRDLEDARPLIRGARHGILFLMFNPGPRGSLLNDILDTAKTERPGVGHRLYIQGVLNQDPSTTKNPIQLFHRGKREVAPYEVVLPASINEQLTYWVEELRQAPKSNAMVHSKVIVVDPIGANPFVITGSHNLGPKASKGNDENLVIIKNNGELARAYAVNIMSIYNQYRWRFSQLTSPRRPPYRGIHDNDTWQSNYFHGPARDELDFWLGVGDE